MTAPKNPGAAKKATAKKPRPSRAKPKPVVATEPVVDASPPAPTTPDLIVDHTDTHPAPQAPAPETPPEDAPADDVEVGLLVEGSQPPFKRPLSRGNTGPYVVWLQTRLIELGYLPAGHDVGRWTHATTQAVKQWQQAEGVTVSGEVNRYAWALLAVGLAPAPEVDEEAGPDVPPEDTVDPDAEPATGGVITSADGFVYIVGETGPEAFIPGDVSETPANPVENPPEADAPADGTPEGDTP